MRLPRWKRLTFLAVVVLLVVGAVELMAKAAGSVIAGRRFSAARLGEQRDALVGSGGRVSLPEHLRWGRDELLHPYVGYVPSTGAGDAVRLRSEEHTSEL